MKETDLTIVTYTNSRPGCDMRIIHTPTGTAVEGSGRVRYLLKKRLMGELRGKIMLRDAALLGASSDPSLPPPLHWYWQGKPGKLIDRGE